MLGGKISLYAADFVSAREPWSGIACGIHSTILCERTRLFERPVFASEDADLWP